jgi:hypothetical protein
MQIMIYLHTELLLSGLLLFQSVHQNYSSSRHQRAPQKPSSLGSSKRKRPVVTHKSLFILWMCVVDRQELEPRDKR